MADEMVLTQEDIDAMVAKAAKEQTASPHVQVVSLTSKMESKTDQNTVLKPTPSVLERQPQVNREPARQTVPEHKVVVKPGKPKETHSAGSKPAIAHRGTHAARTIRRIQNVRTVALPPHTPNEVTLLKTAVNELTIRLARMEIALGEAQKAAANSGINKMFKCDSCGSHSMVSFNVRCTKCGKQSWWGWWPLKRQ